MLRTHHYRVNQSPILNPIQLGMPVSFSMGRDTLQSLLCFVRNRFWHLRRFLTYGFTQADTVVLVFENV